MTTTVYLAGPMRGITDYNYPLFFSVADRLRAMGYKVENPAQNCGITLSLAVYNATHTSKQFADYMKADLCNLSRADAICLLPGWRSSQGARLEYHIAMELGMPTFRWDGENMLPLVTVVGLAGYARSGKDSAAKALISAGYQRLALADLVRRALEAINPWIPEVGMSLSDALNKYTWDFLKSAYPGVRQLLQRCGTEAGRNLLGEDVWVNALLSRMEDGGRYVVTDIRFRNEVAAVLRLGGQVVRITRPGRGPVNDHASEHDLDDVYLPVVHNDGSLQHLQENLLMALDGRLFEVSV